MAVMRRYAVLFEGARRAFVSNHFISSRTSCIRTPGVEMAGLAIKTISQHGPIIAVNCRIDSRIKRRARLRCTALPIFLDVINPIRDWAFTLITG